MFVDSWFEKPLSVSILFFTALIFFGKCSIDAVYVMVYWGLGGLKVKIFLLATEMEKSITLTVFCLLHLPFFISESLFFDIFEDVLS